jgi:hypothetical protein
MKELFRGTQSWISRRTLFRLVASIVMVTLLTLPLISQTAARIEGAVQDESGAVVPKAKITAVNVRTQARAETVSSDQGLYVFAALQPGVYTVTIEATGFEKQVINNVEVNVATTVSQLVKLKVGQATESVTVEASAVAVQTTDSQVARSVTMRDIDTLPQLARTPIALAVYQPGVQINPGDTSFSRVNGTRQGSTNSKLDGIDINDSVVPRLGLSLTSNNTDSVGEFRIVTEGGKAEYGRSAGGQVELITRTGTNNYHGSAFDYLRNTVLNANDFFNKNGATVTPRPKFIQNIFGGSFGGPILKNRTFIFGNYQGRRTKQEVIRNRTVLTPSAKAGIFTWLAGGATQTFNIAANDPRGKGIDPQMAKIFALLPNPNNNDVGDGLNTAGFRFNNPADSYEDQFTIRGDHNLTSTHRVFLRWSWQRNSSIDSLNNADATFPGQVQGTQGGHRWGFSAGSDWNFGQSWVNEFRIGHQSATVAFNRPARLPGPTIVSNSFTDPISSAFAQGRNSPVNDITDNVTKISGSHTFKFGTNVRMTIQQGYDFAGVYPNVTTAVANGNTPPSALTPAGLSTSQTTTFQRLYNDVLGRMDAVALTFYSRDLQTFQQTGTPRTRNYDLNESGYYFQDDWRIMRNLTLNLGVRWELFLPPKEEDKIQATVQGAQSVGPTTQSTNLTVTQNNAWFKTDYNNFAPRVGFAWDVMGDGKTAVRGNYGVFYDRMIGATVSFADGRTPGFSSAQTVNPQRLKASDLPAGAVVGDVRVNDVIPIPPTPGAPALTQPIGNRSVNLALFNPDLRTGYVQQFSLNIQRELLRNTVVEVGYVGNRGVKLFADQDFDQMRIGEDFLGGFKQLQAYVNGGAAPTNNLTAMFPTTVCTANSLTIPSGLSGNAGCAVAALGGKSTFQNGNVAVAANNLDRSFNSQYATIGLPQTYLRNYPQFNTVVVGTNAGRSSYDALQFSVRRSTGALRVAANYTYSHSIDNISVDGNGFTSMIDNFNPASNRANGDADHRHSFNASTSYILPFGKGLRWASGAPRWLDTIIGGWEVGSLIVMQDGPVFTVLSQRQTVHTTGNSSTTPFTFANYSGDKHVTSVHYTPNGVFLFTPADFANFSFPAAGEIGNSGRNSFRGARFFNVDSSLVKHFKITEKQQLTFRAEAYNLLNNPNFGLVTTGTTTNNVNLDQPATFGKFSQTLGEQNNSNSARTLQLTLRYDF